MLLAAGAYSQIYWSKEVHQKFHMQINSSSTLDNRVVYRDVVAARGLEGVHFLCWWVRSQTDEHVVIEHLQEKIIKFLQSASTLVKSHLRELHLVHSAEKS